MNIQLGEDTIYEFENYFGYDLQTYFSEYVNFIERDLPTLQSFYKGQGELTSDLLNRFLSLQDKSLDLTTLVQQNIPFFSRADLCNLVELLDSIRFDIKKIDKLSVFLKSCFVNLQSTKNLTVEKTFSSWQTPELLQSDDPQNSWVDTFVKNRIYESDYDYTNGLVVKVPQTNFETFDVSVVYATFSKDTILGKDIDRIIKYNSDYSDFVTLSQEDTFSQAIEILADYRKADHPFYPNIGLDNELLFGNLIGVNTPFILNELNRTFGFDDTISEVIVESISIDTNSILLKLKVNSILGTNKTINKELRGIIRD